MRDILKILFLVGVVVTSESWVSAEETCVLVEDGRAQATIVLPARPRRVTQFAAAELAYYVEKITGRAIAVVTEPQLSDDAARGYLVLVGETERTRRLGLTNATLQRQEQVIRNHGKWLILTGRDEDEYGPVDYNKADPWPGCRLDSPHRVQFKAWGSLYAADTFLEKVCGVRWYLPGPIGEVCPKEDSIVAKSLDLRLKPWTKTRIHTRPWSWDPFDFYVPGREPKKMIPQREMLLYCKQSKFAQRARISCPNHQMPLVAADKPAALGWLRMKLGGDPWQVNHSVYSYYARFADTHPDWFANGVPKARTHLCYLRPGFLDQHAQDARDYFDGKYPTMKFPDGSHILAAGDYYSAVPIDSSSGWCNCPLCKPLLDVTQSISSDIPGAGLCDFQATGGRLAQRR